MLIVAVLLLASFSLAQDVPSKPNGLVFVSDFANVLGAEQRAGLETMLGELERNTTAELAVVTVNGAQDPFGYSVELFQAWGIGKRSNDNGVLVLYAKEQNRIEVRTGYGVEGILPDAKVGRILDDYYVPLRDVNQTADGIVAATEQIANVIYANADEVRAGRAGVDALDVVLSILASNAVIIFLVILLVVSALAKRSIPKCPVDGTRMRIDHTERTDTFGGHNETVYYKCPKCGHVEKRKRSHSMLLLFAGGMGGRGGGFGGGFGGGGGGGGGAGR